MLIVSGVNVFPSDIEFAIRGTEDITGEYRITAITENFTPDSRWKWKEAPTPKRTHKEKRVVDLRPHQIRR